MTADLHPHGALPSGAPLEEVGDSYERACRLPALLRAVQAGLTHSSHSWRERRTWEDVAFGSCRAQLVCPENWPQETISHQWFTGSHLAGCCARSPRSKEPPCVSLMQDSCVL